MTRKGDAPWSPGHAYGGPLSRITGNAFNGLGERTPRRAPVLTEHWSRRAASRREA